MNEGMNISLYLSCHLSFSLSPPRYRLTLSILRLCRQHHRRFVRPAVPLSVADTVRHVIPVSVVRMPPSDAVQQLRQLLGPSSSDRAFRCRSGRLSFSPDLSSPRSLRLRLCGWPSVFLTVSRLRLHLFCRCRLSTLVGVFVVGKGLVARSFGRGSLLGRSIRSSSGWRSIAILSSRSPALFSVGVAVPAAVH